MAVYFYTDSPKELLEEFNTRIEQNEIKGKITTWERSNDRKYYTHTSKEWHAKAWFKPVVGARKLTFNIIKSKSQTVKLVVYGYYHGHLIETFLNHFDDDFNTGEATAKQTDDDVIS